MAFVLAAGAGAVAWLRENVVPGIFGQVLPEMSDILRDELRLIAVVLAAMGGILHFLSQRNALLLESYKEDLDDVDACAEELAALLDYEDKSEIRQGSLAGFYVRPYRDPFLGRLLTLLRMDPVDRIRLLTAKGLEHGLLENVGPKNVLPASDRRLKITFKPSRFMPVPTPPPTPVPPLPPTVASVMLALCLAAGSGLALLAHLIATAWAYVPGAFSVLFFLASLGCVGALAEGILEAKKEKARGNRGEQAG
jgi:hypothetical protein